MSQENVEIVREIYDAVTKRDALAAFAVYAEAIVWEVSGAAVPATPVAATCKRASPPAPTSSASPA